MYVCRHLSAPASVAAQHSTNTSSLVLLTAHTSAPASHTPLCPALLPFTSIPFLKTQRGEELLLRGCWRLPGKLLRQRVPRSPLLLEQGLPFMPLRLHRLFAPPLVAAARLLAELLMLLRLLL